MSEASPTKLPGPALIVWDMQYGIASRAFNFEEMVQKIGMLRDSFHKSGLPVIYSQHTGVPFEYMSETNIAFLRRRGLDPKAGFMNEGTKEWGIIEQLRPADEDLVLRKSTASFFVGTMLEQMLRNRGIQTLVLTGVSTDGGIEGTARHSSYLGFRTTVVEDAVGSFDKEAHEKALWLMRRMFDVRPAGSVATSIA
jgi:nicotinamidase-related amidase